jgi:hypothetical protein
VSCGSSSSCENTTINCPPDAPCYVECSGLSGCKNATVVCPTDNYVCEVTCPGPNNSTCKGIQIQCGEGPCSLECSSRHWVCDDADLICGTNTCEAICDGSSTPDVICGDACECTEC